VYDRIVNPWVDQYERRVDDAVEEAHRGVRRWIWSRLGGVTWILIGEGGSLAEGILTLAMGFLGASAAEPKMSREGPTIQPSRSTESLPPLHSIREALSQNSFEEVEEVGNLTFNPTDGFVNDFISMLQQGLYVFANVDIRTTDETTGVSKERNDGSKLGIFSYTKDANRAFLFSPVTAGFNDIDMQSSVRIPIDTLAPLRLSGSQGLVLECHCATTHIVLSDESDRDILMNGINACLSSLMSSRHNCD